MKVQSFVVGAFFTNCYVITCEETREAIIVDPGFDDKREAEKIFKIVEENSLKLKYIVNTHGHPDHTCGNGIVKEKFDVPILIHEFDAHMLGETSRGIAGFFGFKNFSPKADVLLHDGDTIKFGEFVLKVMHTPGHSRGSISLIGEKEVFSGDTLFMGSIGRTDFPESSEREMQQSLKKLAYLPDHFVVYPGHGPSTTIEEEKSNNPFLTALNL
ncbi:MBL fold metallo-hydrolase [Candidatus Bathyarchaeota archaeon]|nr:MAG: MBL fold metallo-hydrolase [Candidatus Bathyarchaeota archaeon]